MTGRPKGHEGSTDKDEDVQRVEMMQPERREKYGSKEESGSTSTSLKDMLSSYHMQNARILTFKGESRGEYWDYCNYVDGIENWSYRGLAGPQFWSDEYPMCGGKRQSPINIATAEVKGQYPWTPLRVKDYGKTPKSMTLKNTGHTALVTIVQHPNPSILGGDLSGTYAFVQFQFHWGTNDTSGSEHTIDGNRFQGELHLVHYKTAYGSLVKAMNHEDGLAVLAIFLSVGPKHNPKFNKLFKGLAKVHYADTQKQIKRFPLKHLLPTFVNTFYRYKGSMTYPPCLENTVWTIFKDPVTISANQLTRFRKLTDDRGKPLKSNFRPVQPGSLMVMGGREAPFWLYHGKQVSLVFSYLSLLSRYLCLWSSLI
ncbi:carbonic anhydrase 1-like [Homarus americanus]|uniref:carbonic anhydrase 1-like n=1 Tax=Homarus americanus TaxID=6706 RepID=UPI001C47F440|nr:carbonic anhydrase 1-like [Homarus americanus]